MKQYIIHTTTLYTLKMYYHVKSTAHNREKTNYTKLPTGAHAHVTQHAQNITLTID